MKSFITTFLIIGIVASNLTYAQTTLQYRLNAGDTFKVLQTAKQDIVQNMNGSKHEMTNLLEGDFTFSVEIVTDSLYHIKFKFDRFKMISTSNLLGEIFKINTKDEIPEDDIQGKIFAQLVTTDLYMEMYKTGQIKSVSGSEKLIDNMINSAGDFDDFTREMMKESVRKEFGNESLAQSFEQMTYIYTNKSLRTGDSWSNNFDGEMSATNVWTLEQITNDDVFIKGTSDVIFMTDDGAIAMNLTGKMTTDIVSSLQTGFIKRMTSTSNDSGISIMRDMKNVEVPTTIISEITYKIEKHVQ
ncbi:hypothetical protein SAMN04515667_2639 [Formosa sp. Hel1_31_208]|uniref:DUF6263 family protein n=1 Tax=Formosa sp. Hel1_31_208 TaxID=1798225 RepID=UPI00087D7F7E|nr:DUF6263 family protein [Formosa sp. Hel1_31_208]SDS64339.1 hypothetical protein SAMN04515667_2639 [Formosa sp. Hel1_31_208]